MELYREKHTLPYVLYAGVGDYVQSLLLMDTEPEYVVITMFLFYT